MSISLVFYLVSFVFEKVLFVVRVLGAGEDVIEIDVIGCGVLVRMWL